MPLETSSTVHNSMIKIVFNFSSIYRVVSIVAHQDAHKNTTEQLVTQTFAIGDVDQENAQQFYWPGDIFPATLQNNECTESER